MKPNKPSYTNAEKKLVLAYRKLTETNDFQNRVTNYRAKWSIPIHGFKPTEKDIKLIDDFERMPDGIKEFHSETDTYHEIETELIDFCNWLFELFPINSWYFTLITRNYVFFNEYYFDLTKLAFPFSELNELCQLSNGRYHFENWITDTKKFRAELITGTNEEGNEVMSGSPYTIYAYSYLKQHEKVIKDYPVSLSIHPDASQRDVVEFIKKNWSEIKTVQDMYRDKNKISIRHSKTKRNPKLVARNELIYQNKNLTARDINQKLTDAGFETMDYGSILKVKSLEKKRRE